MSYKHAPAHSTARVINMLLPHLGCLPQTAATHHKHAPGADNMPTTIFQDYGGVLGTNTIVPNWDTNPEDICVALWAHLLTFAILLIVHLTACVNQLTTYHSIVLNSLLYHIIGIVTNIINFSLCTVSLSTSQMKEKETSSRRNKHNGKHRRRTSSANTTMPITSRPATFHNPQTVLALLNQALTTLCSLLWFAVRRCMRICRSTCVSRWNMFS